MTRLRKLRLIKIINKCSNGRGGTSTIQRRRHRAAFTLILENIKGTWFFSSSVSSASYPSNSHALLPRLPNRNRKRGRRSLCAAVGRAGTAWCDFRQRAWARVGEWEGGDAGRRARRCHGDGDGDDGHAAAAGGRRAV